MKKILVLSLVLFTAAVQGQSDSLRISLSDAVALGLVKRFDVQANDYNTFIATSDVNAKQNAWLPELSGAGTVRLNTQIQQAYIPAGFAGLQDPMLVKFGATNIAVFGLDLNQTIFNPNVKNDITIAKSQAELQKQKDEQDKKVIRERITQAYLNVLLRKLQATIARDNEKRFNEYYVLAKGKFDAGALIENEMLRAQLDYENAKLETQKTVQNLNTAYAQLAYQMNVPLTQPLALTDRLSDLQIASLNQDVNYAFGNRSDLLLLNQQRTIAQEQISKSKQAVIPSLSFYANYSKQYTNMNFNFGDSKWWSPYSFVGLNLRVPISAYYKDKPQIASQQLKLKQLELQIEQRKADITYQHNSAIADLQNAANNVTQTQQSYALSKRIYALQQEQVKSGSLLYASLLDTERSLSQAEQNYIRAVYDYMVAQVNFQRAIGEL